MRKHGCAWEQDIGQAVEPANSHGFGLSLMLSDKCAVTSHGPGEAALLPRKNETVQDIE